MHACICHCTLAGVQVATEAGRKICVGWFFCLMKQKLSKSHGRFTELPVFVIYSNSPITIMKHPILWRPLLQRSIGVYLAPSIPSTRIMLPWPSSRLGDPKDEGPSSGYEVVWYWGPLRELETYLSCAVCRIGYSTCTVLDLWSLMCFQNPRTSSRSLSVWPSRAMCDHLDVFVTFHQTLAWWMARWISRNAESKGLQTAGLDIGLATIMCLVIISLDSPQPIQNMRRQGHLLIIETPFRQKSVWSHRLEHGFVELVYCVVNGMVAETGQTGQTLQV